MLSFHPLIIRTLTLFLAGTSETSRRRRKCRIRMIRDKKPGLHDIHKSCYNPNNFPPPYPLTSDPFFTPGQIGQGWNTSNDCNNRIPVVMCKTRFQVRKQETRDMCILCMWLDISMIILYLIYLFSLLPGMPQVDI